MADADVDDPATTLKPSKGATESLSQFVARVLNQLSLSAWLPSATLVLSLLLIFELGAALDAQSASTDENTATGPGPALSSALTAIAHTKLGGFASAL